MEMDEQQSGEVADQSSESHSSEDSASISKPMEVEETEEGSSAAAVENPSNAATVDMETGEQEPS